jgi:hypothetical protein
MDKLVVLKLIFDGCVVFMRKFVWKTIKFLMALSIKFKYFLA